jgi:hypothetical protein
MAGFRPCGLCPNGECPCLSNKQRIGQPRHVLSPLCTWQQPFVLEDGGRLAPLATVRFGRLVIHAVVRVVSREWVLVRISPYGLSFKPARRTLLVVGRF